MLAFACEADEGSEPEIGWKWAHVMAQTCDVTVVTQTKNQARIEHWYNEHPEQIRLVKFSYLELGLIFRLLKKHFPGGMYGYYIVWQWRLSGHVAGIFRKREFDLIHHVTFASFRMPVFVSGAPVVWGPVGGAEMAPMHLLAGYGTCLGRMRERWRNLNTWLAGKLVRIWEPTRHTGGIALASTPATAALLAKSGIPSMILPTIGYDPITPTSLGNVVDPSVPLRLLFVGRLHLLKGVHLLLNALALVEQGRVHLTLVGEGPERKRLQKMVQRLGLERDVTFFGFVHRANLDAVFAKHDVMVAPSLYESGGLSVLEGFANGLPAIVLDCGGHALSVDESCGMKVHLGSQQGDIVRGLASAITAYDTDRELLARHGSAARIKLRETYAWDRKHEAMYAIYRDVIRLREC